MQESPLSPTPLNPYDAETAKMVQRFKELFVEISLTASDEEPRTQKSHTLTAMIQALVDVGLEHLGNRPDAVAWFVNEALGNAMRARSRAVQSARQQGIN